MKELTKAEEQIMQVLWKLGKGFVNDVLDRLPEPKPAYNTVSTIIRILEKKGFVGYMAFGKSHQYFPVLSKQDYMRTYMHRFVNSYFGNSYKDLVSFFTQEENLSLDDMDEIRKLLKDQIDKNNPA